ncbi:hypothetical protein EA796_17615 [Pseudomonas sp. AOB-7]|uniref:DUF7507 domain-containing protein n=1 Tax=Pseudomonas sp. AOB-7 TaxID=2482750 RepID=UPI000EFD3785|nr:hypothetical protein [Pseudomonas sp. AOB-7]RMH82995.1 hypothetical protein EA796_17615 [Pseudomonas sp. AOB-7]
MHTLNSWQTLLRFTLGAVLVGGMTSTVVNAVDGNPPGLFELDANTVDNGGGGDDWGGLYSNPPGSSVAFTTILADPAPLTIFTGGGSKDILDIPNWRHTNGSVPDKDDITNAYAAAYINPSDVSHGGEVLHKAGDMIIYFGLDRFANNGDAHAAFWFFQNDVGLNPNGTFVGQHAGRDDANGKRGDLMVLVEYPQGSNAVPEIKVYEWDPLKQGTPVADNLSLLYSSTSAKCDGTGNKLACATTNTADLPLPAWPYAPKLGNKNRLPAESFFEGGVNVSALLGGNVPCFSSFLAETRSSRSETAQLKDFVLGNFDVCAIEVTKNCVATVDSEDGGNSIKVDFSGTVTNSGALALNDVTVVDDMGTPGDTSDDVVVFGPATLNPGQSENYSGDYNTTAIPATDVVTATGHRNGTSVSATAEASCSPDLDPQLSVDKLCTAALNSAGDGIEVSFMGTVTNTGNVALEDVMVVDDGGTPGDTSDDQTFNIGTLNAGASANYNGSFGVLGAVSSSDSVVASGTDVLGGSPVSASASASCAADTNPAIAVDKVCTADINASGTGIDVSFNGTVRNVGDVVLTGVTVTDDNGTPGVPGDDVTVLGPIDLAPGDSANYSGSFGASGSSSTDTVTASGSDLLTGSPVSETASASCSADVLPALDVTKQCTDAPAFGMPILFDGSVTNSGNVTLLDVIVTDDNGTPGDTSDDVVFNIGNLAPGASANYNGSYDPGVAGPSTNTVVATASDAVESSPVSSSPASATCEVPPPGEEGCTPGFWKNSLGSWAPTGYSPNQTVGSVFSLPAGVLNNQLSGNSLLQALNYGGGENLVGSAQILLRAAVASILNAAHPDVDFTRTAASVIADVNAALATKDRTTILALATALDIDNNLGCDLPNDNSF